MEKINKKDEDAFRKLMHKEGLIFTSPEFTARVMNQVEKIPDIWHYEYKPLLGIKGWTIIISSVAMLITCCIMILSTGNYTSAGYFDFLEPVFGFIKSLEFSMNINLGSIFIGAMVFISIVILLSVDFVFNTKISLE